MYVLFYFQKKKVREADVISPVKICVIDTLF